MANVIRLYPEVKVPGKSFKHVKRCTVPNQSMSLREIVRRFVRRESLPLYNEGLYEERFGDLEKISKTDMVEQFEIIADLKAKIAAYNDRIKAVAKAKADAAAKAAAVVVSGSGGVAPATEGGGTPINSPPPKGA